MSSASSTPFAILRTEHLLLRVFDPSLPTDYAAVLAIYDSPYALRTIGNPDIYTPSDLDTRCRKFHPRPEPSTTSAPFPSHPFHLIYLLAEPSTVIGLTSLYHRHSLPHPDLGYFIIEENTNKGYATEAGIAALKWWTEEMHIPNIWVGTFDNNVVSQRVARKIGFTDGGVIKIVLSDEVTREARAFVQPGCGRGLDGLIVDTRQK